jgi:hypothetical protein
MSFEDENPPKPSGFQATLVVVECGRCGRSFDEAAWLELDLVGYQANVEDDAIIELRNCDCSSTHSIEVDVNEPEGRSILFDAVEHFSVPGRLISWSFEEGGVFNVTALRGDHIEAQVWGRMSLTIALLRLINALPPVRSPEAELLERLVNGSEPTLSHERDTRQEEHR